jgi:cell division protein ZipA
LAELRWILLGLGILAIGAIWWWTARRSGQAPGNAELRESTAAPVHTFGPAAGESAQSVKRSAHAETREWGVPPLEPLNIRTAELERVPELDQPMTSYTDPLDLSIDLGNEFEAAASAPLKPIPPAPAPAIPASAAASATPPPASAPASAPNLKLRPSTENSDRLAAAAAAPQATNASELQKIVTIRVCAVGDARWSGAALMAALEVHGLAYGRYQVYHRKHSDGRSIFCVASLIEPGTFDMARMAETEFRGVTLFAVLPGPIEPLPAVDALLATARELARELSGMLQDTKGVPFSPQHALALREDVARFQALLP